MLGLTFICLYEDINFNVPRESFKLKEDPNAPLYLNVYNEMDRKSSVVRKIPKGESFEGYLVYTGWVLIADANPVEWVYVSKYGKLVIDRSIAANIPIVDQSKLREQIMDMYTVSNQPMNEQVTQLKYQCDTKIHPTESTNHTAPIQESNILPELPPV